MTEAPRKRPAVEPVQALAKREAPLRSDAKRPAATALGAALVLGRAAAGVLWFLAFSLVWPELRAQLQLDALTASILFWIVAAFGLLSALILALFGWLIWRGSNFARVVAMSVLTLSIVFAAIGYFAFGEQITVRTTLLTLALDILVLLALSSREARAWARRPR